jgi:hypothetical protein
MVDSPDDISGNGQEKGSRLAHARQGLPGYKLIDWINTEESTHRIQASRQVCRTSALRRSSSGARIHRQ